MLSRRRMSGEISEHRTTLFHPDVAIGLAEDSLRTRLVQSRMIQKLATMVRICGGLIDRPAGDSLGEADDIVLVVAAAHAQRMELQDFAAEVLVDTAVAVDAGDGVGPY